MGSEWKTEKIGDCFDLVNGFAFKSSDFIDQGIPVIKIKNVKASFFSENDFSYVTPEFIENKGDKLARKNDLLISMSGNRHDGNPETWVGKVARYPYDRQHFLNQRIAALRVKNPNLINPVFASYVLSSWSYQQWFISIATSSGGQANISPKQVLDTDFSFPEKNIQDIVALQLLSLDNKITLNRQLNQTLERMAQALFKSWFVDFDPVIDNALAAGNPIPEDLQDRAERRQLQLAKADHKPLPDNIRKLFPSEFELTESLGWVPKGWGVSRLDGILELAYGKSLSKTEREQGSVPVYGSGGVTGYHNQSIVDGPGIIVGRKGTVGSLYWEPQDFFPIDTVFYVKPFDGISLEYCFLLLQTLGLEDMNTDAAVPGLNRNNAYRLEFSLPTNDVLGQFTLIAKSFREKLDRNVFQINSLVSLRDTLLPKLISGELRIPEAQAQLEEALG